ncbi:macrolide ABC transporter ATP-binding protein [Alishewanella longhuensis]|uniref:Macrolide ABC transporter ATP-binding protein n=1 Tax=Alishewanella longhuensis TaxID=1091037 RepID=A0ABQ3L3R9_9ALTE|nr:ABC transporter ATP-binding protein [Alishewanella longhuensis]GHG69669.1 macrolide ABC transporter ATP-binding protein [Alishewanella longhuensis]
MTQVVIASKGIEKHYQMGEQQVKALKGINVAIYQGDFVAVMGPSGSGKSTFMNMLGCLDSPSAGNITLKGTDVTHLKAAELAEIRNRYIGFVFQQFNLLPRTTALDNVMLPLLYTNIGRAEAIKRASECLTLVGLGSRMDHHPSQLSGGQQQRVAIARALVNKPAIILADEPTGALDTETGLEIMALFQQLHKQGTTLVLVTHEPDIAAFASRQLVFRDGLLLSDRNSEPEDAGNALQHFRQTRLAEALT